MNLGSSNKCSTTRRRNLKFDQVDMGNLCSCRHRLETPPIEPPPAVDLPSPSEHKNVYGGKMAWYNRSQLISHFINMYGDPDYAARAADQHLRSEINPDTKRINPDTGEKEALM